MCALTKVENPIYCTSAVSSPNNPIVRLDTDTKRMESKLTGAPLQLIALPPILGPEANFANSQTVASGKHQFIRCNKQQMPLDETKINVASTKAFLEVGGGIVATSSRIHNTVGGLGARSARRGMPQVGTDMLLGWDHSREKAKDGVRNSNTGTTKASSRPARTCSSNPTCLGDALHWS